MVEHDEAMDRLRTSDPATGSHPDLRSLRALVAQKAPASQGSDEVTRLHDDTLRGPRTAAPWIVAAAVAAIGVGGGGYALGAHQADPPPLAGGTSVTTDPSSSAQDEPVEGRSELPGEPEGLEPGPDEDSGWAMGGDGDVAYDSAAGWDMGPVRLSAGEGLPAGPGTGEVLAVRYEGDPQEVVDRLAAELGMDAQPLPEDGDPWSSSDYGAVDPTTGQVIQANLDGGTLNLHYESVFASEWCASMFEGYPEEDLAVVREDWARSYGPDMPLPGAESCRPLEGPAPSEEEAEAAAEQFLALLDVDLSGHSVQTYGHEAEVYGEDGGDPPRTVSVDYYAQDLALQQFSYTVMVGPGGVVTSAYGGLGELVSLGEYPVISATEAVARYGERTWGTDWQVSIPEDHRPWTGAEELSMPAYEMPEQVALAPGDPIPLLLKDKTVTGAELVQGSLYTQTAGAVEVPVWKLTTGDGMHYSVLALADEALDFRSWE